MVIKLHIKYKTKYGQSFFLRLGSQMASLTGATSEVRMEYLNEEYWYVFIDTKDFLEQDYFSYDYFLREDGKTDETDLCRSRKIHLKKIKADAVNVFDEWQVVPIYENVFHSKPFIQVLDMHRSRLAKRDKPKKVTHLFKVFVPYLQQDRVVCMAGSAKALNEWSEIEPVLLHRTKDSWSVALNLGKDKFPVTYKFGIYDLNQKKVLYFEDGINRQLEHKPEKESMEIYHSFPLLDKYRWKGAGINVPVSALKSGQSWGVGDFTDLHLLVDWARETGFKLIQLLPINDTTATHSIKDSYPYASISAFALHPLYLNVRKLFIAAGIEISPEKQELLDELNHAPRLDYEAVIKIKNEAIRELYLKEKLSFKDDLAFFEFFDLNRFWLVPYAAFCYLRDHHNTADATKWKDYAQYDEEVIQELASPDQAHYDEIAFHYFTQYHLHLQLLDAVEYAHRNGIILKGDLPIGVGRHSVETWMHPTLFHMDMQAGAPPDAFAVKGQNWEFPTYNWEQMAKNNYAWWRQRLEHMSNYFDAVRIDHILGFFRIWSIPLKDIQGILGVFAPALPLSIHDFESAGIHFDAGRFTNPYITDEMISRNFPGNETWVKSNVFNNYKFKSSFNTQHKIAAYFKKNASKSALKDALFNLLTDLILIPDQARPGYYHFRINMQFTDSFKALDHNVQEKLNYLYKRYFFGMQDELWQEVGNKKLDALQLNTEMLLCAEDLGMVPDFVENVLNGREILSLQVQRMPKKVNENFSHPSNANYLSVVTPSTHDMSPLRQWWEEEKDHIQYFFNYLLEKQGTAPFYCEPWICREIIQQHVHSPALFAVFLLQDLLAIDGNIRRENPAEERINVPANPNHHWDYRMHLTLESLLEYVPLKLELNALVKQGGR